MKPAPGTARVYVYPNARDGRVIADVVRLNKGHTEGLEPKVTEELIKMIVSAPGHSTVTTHLFVAGSEYLDSDAVFGVKESLVAQFDRHPPGTGPNGERMDTPFYTVNYDFRLRPASSD